MRQWEPHSFLQQLIETKATLTSLVPAQLFDLLKHDQEPPPSLRALFIGGGSLASPLYQQALTKGWPLLPTYGMTECASQVATAKLGDSTLYLLPHIQAKLNAEGQLMLHSPSLLTGQLIITHETFEWHDPKVEGWYTSEDRVELSQGTLHFKGRLHDWIKIGGENVSLTSLEELFDTLKQGLEAVLLALPDPRLGHRIGVATLEMHRHEVAGCVAQFNAQVMPYEQIRTIHTVPYIPRSQLGKVLKAQLVANLN
jgi:O-succinylbenzoic acid--CoA ligase